MATNEKFLGTPYERGNSDSIVSRQNPNNVGMGLIVGMSDAVSIALGGTAFGVTGKQEIGATDVIVTGLEVYVQTDLTADPTIGGQVFYDPATGKIVAQGATGAVGLNATFTTALNAECYDIKGVKYTGIGINFAGGL